MKLNDESETEWPEEVFLQISESQVGRAIRTKDWKYSVRAEADGWEDMGSKIYYEDFLYDLHTDPYEKRNLVNEESCLEIRAQLAERMKIRMQEAGEEMSVILPCKNQGINSGVII